VWSIESREAMTYQVAQHDVQFIDQSAAQSAALDSFFLT
jgi:hypothetical protein